MAGLDSVFDGAFADGLDCGFDGAGSFASVEHPNRRHASAVALTAVRTVAPRRALGAPSHRRTPGTGYVLFAMGT
jgi:hypothetical protein